MPTTTTAATFGELLKYLRRRARLTQRELAQAVGYTEAHVCRLEKNQRPPDLASLAALFGPALDLDDEPETMARLLQLATAARGTKTTTTRTVTVSEVTIQHETIEELGALEDVPPLPAHAVTRSAVLARVRDVLHADKRVAVCGLAGLGKTMMAATIAREYEAQMPVFWLTLTPGVTATIDAILRQLALFLLTQGHSQLQPLAHRQPDGGLSLDQQITLIGAALNRQPTLVCFDDVHIVQDSEPIMTLLRHLSTATSAFLLLISREAVPLSNVMSIDAAGLTHAEAVELIDRLGLQLPPALIDRLWIKTGGSPMLLRLAIGQLLARRSDPSAFIDHLETQPQVAAYVVDTVLRDLTPSARWLIGLMAVFRRPIDLYDETLIELIERASGPAPLQRALAELQRRYLIDHAQQAALHPLVRDHIQATLSIDRAHKKRLHRLAADWSEQVARDIVEAAYHFCAAGNVARAAELLADQSESLFNAGQALAAAEVVDMALARLRLRPGEAPDVRRLLLTARGDVLKGTLRAGEAEASYREALALAQHASNAPIVRAQIVRALAQSLTQRGQVAEALRLCQSAAADLPAPDVVLRARLAVMECRAHLALSHYDDAERMAHAALTLVDQFAEYLPSVADDVIALAERTLGWISYTRHPQSDAALVHYRRALTAARRSGRRVHEGAVLSNIGTALIDQGDWAGAVESYQASLAIFESLGNVYSMAAVLHNLAELHHKRNELAESLQRLEQVCEMERRIGDQEGLLSSEAGRAALLLDMGHLAEARAVLDDVLREAGESSDTWTLGTCLIMLAEVQVLQGEVQVAHANLARVLAMPGVQDNARIWTWAQSALVLAHLAEGDAAAAQRIGELPIPADVGVELSFRWEIITCLIRLARGDEAGGRALAQSIAQHARAIGHLLNAMVAERIAASHAVPVKELPRLLYPL
jgi:ATP/maltotriose-dependent transcriptional regulator MalT/DNA-binding XRE family transcriptional regulator